MIALDVGTLVRTPLVEQHVGGVGLLEAEIEVLLRYRVVGFAGHFASKALCRNLRGVEQLDFSIVEEEPTLLMVRITVFVAFLDEAVVMASVGISRVNRHPNEIVFVMFVEIL